MAMLYLQMFFSMLRFKGKFVLSDANINVLILKFKIMRTIKEKTLLDCSSVLS